MAEFEDICLTHVRRGVMRHAWRRFIRHDWERFLKPDWETRMKPGSSVAADMYHQLKAEQRRQWPAYYAQATREEIAAEKAAYEEYQAELAELRGMLADLKLDLLRREFARKAFDPSQPRVSAGSPDGGQWTSGDEGSGRNDPRVLSDATPDNTWKPGAQYAQGSRSGGHPVDLRDEEARGGHTIQAHVNRSREALIAEAQAAFDRNPNARDSRSGSFPSLETANKLVNSTLAQNQAAVEQVASGLRDRAIVFASFDAATGTEAVIPNRQAQAYFRETYGVGVVIFHDRFSPKGFTILTAFPSNRNQ